MFTQCSPPKKRRIAAAPPSSTDSSSCSSHQPNTLIDKCCRVLALSFPYQSIIEHIGDGEFPPDLRARLAAHSFPRTMAPINAYYGPVQISARKVRQVGFRVIGQMWAGQSVSLDCDRGAIVKASCSCGGESGGLCAHQLATIAARVEQQQKHGINGISIQEPLSDTVLRMSREQLAAALLEIASPHNRPWLVGQVGDVVKRVISEHTPPGVSVPTYPQSSSMPLNDEVTWFFGVDQLESRPSRIKGERLVEIERSAGREFDNLERLSFLPGSDNDMKLLTLVVRVLRALKDALEDLFLYQSDLLENTPGDPDPEDEGVFGDWVDARHPKELNLGRLKSTLYLILARSHHSQRADENLAYVDAQLGQLSADFAGFAQANQESRAFGPLRAARHLSRLLHNCRDLSKQLGRVEVVADLGSVFDVEQRTLDLLTTTMTLAKSARIEADFEVFIQLLLDNCVNEHLTKWTIDARDGLRGELNQTLIKQLFRGMCPQLNRKHGNVALIVLALFDMFEFDVISAFNAEGALSTGESRHLLLIVRAVVRANVKMHPTRLGHLWESVLF